MSFWQQNITLLAMLAALCSLPAYAQPFLTISPAQWDFQTIKDDKMVGHTFIVKNYSQRPVKLETLPSSCGCMIARPEPALVPAGGEAKFHVMFQPKGRSGAVRWQARLKTDHPQQPVLVLPLTAYVLRDALVSEDIVNFGVFKRGSRPKIELRMACRHYPQFKLLKAEFDGGNGFDIKFKAGEVEGLYPGHQRGYHIEITANANIAYGRNHGKFVFHTTIPGHEKITVPLQAYVLGDLTAVPDYLAFGLIPRHIFSVKPVTKYQDDLAQPQLSPQWQRAFAARRHRLSAKTRLQTLIAGQQWLVTDAANSLEFYILKAQQQFDVYQKNLTRKITITHNKFQKFTIAKAVSELPFVSTRLQTVIPDKYYYLYVTLNHSQQLPLGEFRGKLTIFTNCATQPQITVRLQGINRNISNGKISNKKGK